MDYPFQIPGQEGLNLALRSGGILTGTKLLQDGQIVPRVNRKYVVKGANGEELALRLQAGIDIFRPKVFYGEQVISAFPAMPVYLVVLAYLPLLMLFVGGALGGLIGGIGAGINFMMLERDMPAALKVLICLAIFLVSFVIYITLGIYLAAALRH